MVAGLLKKARNSGEIASITANVVYNHDKFTIILGDNESLEHVPDPDVPDEMLTEANARGAYAIAHLRDGTIVRSYLSRGKILRARDQSRAKGGMLWTKFWDEAWCKTAIRHLTKKLPASTDKEGTEAFIRAAERDDHLYEFDRAHAPHAPHAQQDTPPASGSRLERFVAERKSGHEGAVVEHREPASPVDDSGDDPGQPIAAAEQGSQPPETQEVVLILPGMQPETLPIAQASELLLDTAERKNWDTDQARSVFNRNPWIERHDQTRSILDALFPSQEG
jgi:recombination protein RecT